MNASTAGNDGGFTLIEGTVLVNAANPFGLSSSLTTGVLTLTGGTLISGINMSGANAISNPVTINSSLDVLAGSNNIQFSNEVTNNGSTRLLTNDLANTATLTLSNALVALNLSENTSTARTFVLAGTGNTTISGPIWNANTANANATVASAFQYQGTGTLGPCPAANPFFGAANLLGGNDDLERSDWRGTASTPRAPRPLRVPRPRR